MKSDRLSPNPDEEAEPCFWSSKACSPALRFLALFLLFALAKFTGSPAVCGPFSLVRCELFCDLEIRLGPSTLMTVFVEHFPQRMTFDTPFGMARGCAAGFGNDFAVVLCGPDDFLALEWDVILSVWILRVSPWPGIMMWPQALHACWRWASDIGMPFSTSTSLRRLMRKADVSGADCESRWAASLRKRRCGDISSKRMFKLLCIVV